MCYSIGTAKFYNCFKTFLFHLCLQILTANLNGPRVNAAVPVAKPCSRGHLTVLRVQPTESPFWSWSLRSWMRRILGTAASPPLWLTSWLVPSRKVAAPCSRSPPAPFPAMRYGQWGRPAFAPAPLFGLLSFFCFSWSKCPSLGPVALYMNLPACCDSSPGPAGGADCDQSAGCPLWNDFRPCGVHVPAGLPQPAWDHCW